PGLRNRLLVIEHGCHRTIGEKWPRRSYASDAQPRRGMAQLNVAIIGALDRHKGLGVLKDLLRANRNHGILFHFYGTAPDATIMSAHLDEIRHLEGSSFVYHGPYDSRHIARRMIQDRIDVGLQLAVWPETFSYTL